MLFVVNSLAIQVSDFGVGFAVLRSRHGEPLDVRSLWRLRGVGAAIAAAGVVLGLVVGGLPGAVIAAGGVVWALSAEAYVRKAAALKAGHPGEVALAEGLGAAWFLAGTAVLVATGTGAAWVAALFVGKHLLEVAVVRDWRASFARGAAAPRSGPEWLGQLATYLVANVDYLVLGLVLLPADLSLYVVAFRVASALPALVANPITQTAFLDLAATRDRAHRQEVYDRIMGRVACLGAMGAGAVLLAAPVLPWLLGPDWVGVGWLVAVLAPAVPFRLLLGTTVAQAVTVGAARSVVGWEAVRLAVIGVATLIAAQFGLVPATAVVSIATIVTVGGEHLRSCTLGGVRADRRLPWAAAACCAVVVGFAVLASM